jgi:hypothetical protein
MVARLARVHPHVELAVALDADVQSRGERFLLPGAKANSDNVPLATLPLVGGEAGYWRPG